LTRVMDISANDNFRKNRGDDPAASLVGASRGGGIAGSSESSVR
jgi:hypothetical protein